MLLKRYLNSATLFFLVSFIVSNRVVAAPITASSCQAILRKLAQAGISLTTLTDAINDGHPFQLHMEDHRTIVGSIQDIDKSRATVTLKSGKEIFIPAVTSIDQLTLLGSESTSHFLVGEKGEKRSALLKAIKASGMAFEHYGVGPIPLSNAKVYATPQGGTILEFTDFKGKIHFVSTDSHNFILYQTMDHPGYEMFRYNKPEWDKMLRDSLKTQNKLKIAFKGGDNDAGGAKENTVVEYVVSLAHADENDGDGVILLSNGALIKPSQVLGVSNEN